MVRIARETIQLFYIQEGDIFQILSIIIRIKSMSALKLINIFKESF